MRSQGPGADRALHELSHWEVEWASTTHHFVSGEPECDHERRASACLIIRGQERSIGGHEKTRT